MTKTRSTKGGGNGSLKEDSEINGTDNNTNSKQKQRVFVCRNIVRKKKDPQQTMKKYFAVTKPLTKRVEKNFQGLPMKDCKFEHSISDYAYCPPRYPPKPLGGEDGDGEAEFCIDCLLRPCVVRGRWDDIMCFCEDSMIFEQVDDVDFLYGKLVRHMESILVELFGPRYTRNNPTPPCVYDALGKYLEARSLLDDEGSGDGNPDDELLAGATDLAEYI